MNAIFFKHPSSGLFIAIHQDEEFYIHAGLWRDETSIKKVHGKNRTEFQLGICLQEYTEITGEEFVDAINRAHSILLNTPYL